MRRALVCSALLLCAPALAQTTLTFSTSTNDVATPITILIGGTSVPVSIPPNTIALNKRNLVLSALQSAGFTASTSGTDSVSLTSPFPVTISTGATGEVQDGCRAIGAPHGVISFQGTFNTTDRFGQPSVFYAGITTNTGTTTAILSSTQINNETDGTNICLRLYQQLLPRTAAYGFAIVNSGDHLDVYFQPPQAPHANTNPGVLFGTSATNPGCSGSIQPPPVCGSADFNHDGDVGTDADIEAFFACLAGNCCATCGSADFNGDGDTGTDADIEAFFRVLGGGAC